MTTIRLHTCEPCGEIDGIWYLIPRVEVARRHRIATTQRRINRRARAMRELTKAQHRKLARALNQLPTAPDLNSPF